MPGLFPLRASGNPVPKWGLRYDGNVSSEVAPPSQGGARFPPVPDSVRAARRLVRQVLARHGLDAGDAELLVSELATNVVDHAGTPFRVEIEVGETVLIAIEDASPRPPLVAPRRLLAERGRGLLLVTLLATRWGFDGRGQGKRVWFELEAKPATGRAPLA